jgi:hypothetical protein
MSPRRAVFALILALLASLAVSPAAGAVPKPRLIVGGVLGPPVSDGSRYAAFGGIDSVHVVDDRNRRTFQSPACGPPRALGAGHVLFSCSERTGQFSALAAPYVLSVKTRVTLRVPEPREGEYLEAIGGHWIGGTACLDGCRTNPSRYVNWRTGERRDFQDEPPLARNLDRTSLTLREPAGVRLVALVRGPLILRDGNRRIRLSQCVDGCGHATVGAGVVTWSEATKVRAYLLASHRRLAWAFAFGFNGDPRGSQPDLPVVHTRRRVFVQVYLDFSRNTSELYEIDVK